MPTSPSPISISTTHASLAAIIVALITQLNAQGFPAMISDLELTMGATWNDIEIVKDPKTSNYILYAKGSKSPLISGT